jgi:hypothetical protein
VFSPPVPKKRSWRETHQAVSSHEGKDFLTSSFRNEFARRMSLPHDPWSKVRLGLMGIVSPAPQLKISRVCGPAPGERNDVVKFQKSLLSAAATRADECASTAVA